MDKTETYEKMSNNPHIQSQWEPQEGDYFVVYEEFEDTDKSKKKTREVYIIGNADGGGDDIGTGWCGCCWREIEEDKIWLPTQDQIQGMMGIRPSGNTWIWLEEFGGGFHEFYSQFTECEGRDIERDTTEYARQFDSMEQLWLAYYMHHGKAQKIWDGEKWVKNK